MTAEKESAKRRYSVQGYFPDLASAKPYQDWTGEASNIGMASYLAYKEIRKRPGVAKKRLHNMRLTIVEVQG